MGVLTAVLLMLPLPKDTWIRLIVWMVIGLVIYQFYGKSNSVLGNKPPEGSIAGADGEG